MIDRPTVIFVMSVALMWLSAQGGVYVAQKQGKMPGEDRADLNVILTAALTLLGLIIGFSFSMAVSRYDLRKSDEANEANAIGTELARAGLLAPDAATRVRDLLQGYLKERIRFYTTRDEGELRALDAATAQTQSHLWSAVVSRASDAPAPLAALVLSGMNDVLNSQGYTQAAWWNRIPIPAWVLMAAIALCCNCMIGYTSRHPEGHARRLLLLPMIVSIAFFLIADIDSPRHGIIRVHAPNLESVLSGIERSGAAISQTPAPPRP
jgi:hypothetical protein